MELPIKGGCFCEKVRYAITQPPKRMGICHCRACQKATGSSYFPYVAALRDAVTITGNVKWHESLGHSGNKINRGFCDNCGTTLFGKPDAWPHIMTISASSLDNLSHYQPEIQVWVDEAQHWCYIDPKLKKIR